MSVIVAGSANIDVVVFSPRQPVPGETLTGHGLRFVPGGKGACQATAAARLGTPTRFLVKLGIDYFGDMHERFLREQGIDLSLMQRTGEAATGTACGATT